MHFIPKKEVTFKTKKVTYPKIVCDIHPSKAETHRTCITVGENLLDYAGTLTTPAATITTAKCLFNSVMSTPEEKCALAYIYILPQQRSPRSRVYEIPHSNYTTGDNSTAVGISNKSIKQKRSKAMDMRFRWIQDIILQEHFNVF